MKEKQVGAKGDFHFRLMAISYKFRDFFAPRGIILQEVGIKAGDSVLDFGCGPGSYIKALAKMVGLSGRIYALDKHPLAIKMVERLKIKKNWPQVITILSNGTTGLPDHCLDVVILYDVFHEIDQPELVLRELHRVLKPAGFLSVSDHHLKEEEIISGITRKGLFQFLKKGKGTFSFRPVHLKNG